MAPVTIPLQPAHRHRLLPPGVTGLHLPAMFEQAGVSLDGPTEERRHDTLLRFAGVLLNPPDAMTFAWHFLDGVRCLWLAGGNRDGVEADRLAAEFDVPVFFPADGAFAVEEGGLAMLEELNCEPGMVCDLGQTMFKVSWMDRRRAFARDLLHLPFYSGPGVHSIADKGYQRRVLRRFVAESVRAVVNEAGEGEPQGVVFALPSALDKWGQPAGSSYIGMSMDTQLVTDALELAGLPDIPHWLLNDAELAAASAVFDERVIACGGKALVFTLGTAVGCALADPLAAALHFCDTGKEGDSAVQS
jgi:hypothetical protein